MPPPPPPPPASGPPRGMKPPVKFGAVPDRSALLSSIQKGATLKKTVTNDRSSPMINVGKIISVKSSSNGGIQGSASGTGMVNGGLPQLGGLFAQGMPKLRPTGRGRNDYTDSGSNMRLPGGVVTSLHHFAKKPSAPPTPPSNTKPTYQSPQPNSDYGTNDLPPSNGYLPPSPKPSSKSNPAPPPPPSNRKPLMGDRGTAGGRTPFLDIPSPSSKPVSPRPLAEENSNQSEERHPPLPIKPAFILRPDPGSRGAPPRPPSSSKPNLPPKSPDIKPSNEPRRPSIDRSISLREPQQRPPFSQVKVGTSAESPAAPFRVNTNHREAPPIPSSRPIASKTVGRAAGAKLMMPVLRPPSEKPPKPPSRPVVAAPPPPSQPPPPPPPSNRVVTASSPLSGGKADVPLPPIPKSTIPPPLPERNESTRAAYNKQPDDFESKFSKLFKSRHQFPLPLTYNHVPKSYPSKSNAKNQRRAPLPPTANPTPPSTNAPPAPPLASNKPSPHSHGPSTYLHSMGNNPPPPPPPHAPLHLQMDRKFYGTETSHC